MTIKSRKVHFSFLLFLALVIIFSSLLILSKPVETKEANVHKTDPSKIKIVRDEIVVTFDKEYTAEEAKNLFVSKFPELTIVSVENVSNKIYKVTAKDIVKAPETEEDTIFGTDSNVIEFKTEDLLAQPYQRLFDNLKLNIPEITEVTPNYIYEISFTPNDSLYSLQWSHRNTRAEQAWDVQRGSEDVVVAVIDTGVDLQHPDLQNNLWVNQDEIAGNNIDDDNNGFVDDINGYDFVALTNTTSCNTSEDCRDRDSNPDDFHAHGTHVAGIAAGVSNNSRGITGVCHNCKIMALRAGYSTPDGGGSLPLDAIIGSLEYAVDNNADVVNMSFGGGAPTTNIQNIINSGFSEGTIFIAAAGNSSSSYAHYPAAYDNVVAVAAMDINNLPASFTNHGTYVDIAAPGVNLLSTVPLTGISGSQTGTHSLGYASFSGTSMASPYVAGSVALIKSQYPSLSTTALVSLLKNSVDPIPPQVSLELGTGNINLSKAFGNSDGSFALITAPDFLSEVHGTVDIRGFIQAEDLVNYKVYIGRGAHATTFEEIYTGTSEVGEGGQDGIILPAFNSSLLSEGENKIRIIVRTEDGNSTFDFIVKNVNNLNITFPLNRDVVNGNETIELSGQIVNNPIRLEWGIGNNPSEWSTSGFEIVNTGNLLGRLNTTNLNQNGEYTIRLVSILNGFESYEELNLVIDKTLKPNWPKRVGVDTVNGNIPFPGQSAITLADLNNDGQNEIITTNIGIDSKERNLVIYSQDGSTILSKEIYTNQDNFTYGGFFSRVSVGDIDNDGKMNLLFVVDKSSRDSSNRISDKSYLENWEFNSANSTSPLNLEWSRETLRTSFNSIRLINLNSSSEMEVVVGAMDRSDFIFLQKFFVFDSSGNLILEKTPGYVSDSSLESFLPLTINTDSDPELELIYNWRYGNNAIIKVIQLDGTESILNDGENIKGRNVDSLVSADLDRNGKEDIIFNTHKDSSIEGFSSGVYSLNSEGNLLEGWPALTDRNFRFSPVVADLNNDGNFEVITYSAAQPGQASKIFVLNNFGQTVSSWDATTITQGGLIATNLDTDSDLEIAFTNGMPEYIQDSNQTSHSGVYAWNIDGSTVNGFPKLTEHATFTNPTVADTDGDGKGEILTSTIYDAAGIYNRQNTEEWQYKNRISFYQWDLEAPNSTSESNWPTFLKDNKRTGTITPTDPIHKITAPIENAEVYKGEHLEIKVQGRASRLLVEYGQGENPSAWVTTGLQTVNSNGIFERTISRLLTSNIQTSGIYTIRVTFVNGNQNIEKRVKFNLVDRPLLEISSPLNNDVKKSGTGQTLEFLGKVKADSIVIDYKLATAATYLNATITDRSLFTSQSTDLFARVNLANANLSTNGLYEFRIKATKGGITETKIIRINLDNSLKAGWPRTIANSDPEGLNGLEFKHQGIGQAVTEDLNNDGKKEIVILNTFPVLNNNETKHRQVLTVLKFDGSILWRKELNEFVELRRDGSAMQLPTVYDIDGDNDKDIVLIEEQNYDYRDSNDVVREINSAGLIAFNYEGTQVYNLYGSFVQDYAGYGNSTVIDQSASVDSNGNPISLNPNIFYRFKTAESGKAMLIDQYFYGEGSNRYSNVTNRVLELPINSGTNFSSVLYVDFNKADVAKEFVAVTNDPGNHNSKILAFYDGYYQPTSGAYYQYGSPKAGWPKQYNGYIKAPIVAGDLNNDDLPEMVFGTANYGTNLTNSNGLYAINTKGEVLSGWPKFTDYDFESAPALTDLNKDGKAEVIAIGRRFSTINTNNEEYKLFITNVEGQVLEQWAIHNPGKNGPIIANVDNNPDMEILVSFGTPCTTPNGFCTLKQGVTAYKQNGTSVVGFPKYTDNGVISAPIVEDIDGNGVQELIVTSMADADIYAPDPVYKNRISVYAWELNQNNTPNAWPKYLKDSNRTGKLDLNRRDIAQPVNSTSEITTGGASQPIIMRNGLFTINEISYGVGNNPTQWSTTGITRTVTQMTSVEQEVGRFTIPHTVSSESTYVLKIRYTDNGVQKEARVNLAVNNIEEFRVTGPLENSQVEIGNSVSITAKGRAVTLNATYGPGTNPTSWTNIAVSNLNLTTHRGVGLFNTTGLSPGIHTIRIRYQDNFAGIAPQMEKFIRINLVEPAHFRVTSPTSQQLVANTGTLDIKGTGYARNIAVDYKLESENVYRSAGVTNISTQSGTDERNVARLDLSNLTQSGTYVIRVNYDFTAPPRRATFVRVNVIKPVSIVTPTSGSTFTIGETENITFEIEGNTTGTRIFEYSKNIPGQEPSWSSAGIVHIEDNSQNGERRALARIDTARFYGNPGEYTFRYKDNFAQSTSSIILNLKEQLSLDVTSPINNDIISNTNPIVIEGTAIAANKKFQVGIGEAPTEWQAIEPPQFEFSNEEGIIGIWDASELSNNLYTIKITVSNSNFTENLVKTVKVIIESGIVENWPIEIPLDQGNYNYFTEGNPGPSQPIPADLNEDGQSEIVIYYSNPTYVEDANAGNGYYVKNNRVLKVFNRQGIELWSKDVSEGNFTTNGISISKPAIGDLNNDGDLEIVVVDDFYSGTRENWVKVFDFEGNLVWKKPINSSGGNMGNKYLAVIEDVDSNGSKEVIIRSTFFENNLNTPSTDESTFYVFSGNGDVMHNFNTLQGNEFIPSGSNSYENQPFYNHNVPNFVLVNLDSDIEKEIVFAAEGSPTQPAKLHFRNVDGSLIFINTEVKASRYSSVYAANLDSDMDFEIIVTGDEKAADAKALYVVDSDGSVKEGWSDTPAMENKVITKSIGLADYDNNGTVEIYAVTTDENGQNQLSILNNLDEVVSRWGYVNNTGYYGPIIGNADSADSRAEALLSQTEPKMINYSHFGNWPNRFSAVYPEGIDLWDFRDNNGLGGGPANPEEDVKRTSHGAVASPVLADLDGDGDNEILASTIYSGEQNEEGNYIPNKKIQLYMWETGGSSENNNKHWTMTFGNLANTSVYTANIPEVLPNDCGGFDVNGDCQADSIDLGIVQFLYNHANSNGSNSKSMDVSGDAKYNLADSANLKTIYSDVCEQNRPGDINNDCKIDAKDKAILAGILKFIVEDGKTLRNTQKLDFNGNKSFDKMDLVSMMEKAGSV